MDKRLTQDELLQAELDSEDAQLEARLIRQQRQRQALARLREICEPYLRENPNLTIGEALELDRRARPWAYRKPN
ncbi:MAG: hypothetical protein KatS3mg004_2869 [Bryobacteraceae bacterium]|nr:MAG: hypothetical protein KatS3mg004_2869 [Bryobacteraceae bacterium]